MASFSVEKTPKSPEIRFDFDKGRLEIRGCSTPENATDFYRPLIEAIEKYSSEPKPHTEADVFLNYFNTSSSKMIFTVFKKLSGVQRNGSTVLINWYHEDGDDDMLEAGMDYQSIIDVPFKMISVPEE
jgi:hypothetical protein